MGQNLGLHMSSQGQFDQAIFHASQEAATGHEDTEDETDQCDQASEEDLSERSIMEASADSMAKSLRSKEKEWTTPARKEDPLRLLDLPLDLLKLILNQVSAVSWRSKLRL